jgi:hypothetical protein
MNGHTPHGKTFTEFDRRYLKSLRISPDPPKHKKRCQGDGCDCGDTDHADHPKGER